MKIAILGGSFDPPHNGHVKIAREIIIETLADNVWPVPCFSHAFNKDLSSPNDRLNMTKMLEEKNIVVSDYEIKKGGVSLSIETLNELSNLFPDNSFSWVIGSDQIEDFPKWENWQTIIEKFGLVVARRGEDKDVKKEADKVFGTGLASKVIFLSSQIPDISSTDIRNRVKQSKPIHALVPKSVEEYIIKNKLYN